MAGRINCTVAVTFHAQNHAHNVYRDILYV